jgi:hypothetical protein
MSNDEDVWPRQRRQVGGLRLVGARPVVSASPVSDLMACLRLVGARQEMIIFIGKGRVGRVASHRHFVSARTMLMQGVDVESK